MPFNPFYHKTNDTLFWFDESKLAAEKIVFRVKLFFQVCHLMCLETGVLSA